MSEGDQCEATEIKVEALQGDTYQVVQIYTETYDADVLFQGSLSDCEAFIRLREGGYLR